MKRSGKAFTEADFEAAYDYQRKLVAMTGAGASWTDIQAWVATARGQPWADIADVPQSNDDSQLDYFRRAPHDSDAALRRTRIPLLAVFGELDFVVPPRINVAKLERHLEHAGNRDYGVVVFPGADHDLLVPERKAGPAGDDYRWQATPPDYVETLTAWVVARVGR